MDEPRYWLHAPATAPIGVLLKTQARQLAREGQRRGHSTIVLDRARRPVMLFGVLASGAFTEVEGQAFGRDRLHALIESTLPKLQDAAAFDEATLRLRAPAPGLRSRLSALAARLA